MRILRETLSSKYPMHGLTQSLATTFLQVGLCQEIAQSFSFEYFKKYQDRDVTLVFADGNEGGHMFVLIAPIAPEIATSNLVTGVTNTEINPDNAMNLSHFLSLQPSETVMVDPYIFDSDYANRIKPNGRFAQYCRGNNATIVYAVKLYKTTDGLEKTSVLKMIEDNAKKLAGDLFSALTAVTQMPLKDLTTDSLDALVYSAPHCQDQFSV